MRGKLSISDKMAKDEPNEELEIKNAIESCMTAQTMIDINTEHLEGLRTLCTTSATLTQQEIRTLENKLLRLFSGQFYLKTKCGPIKDLTEYPRLKQWLHVVGLSPSSNQKLSQEVKTMEGILQFAEPDLEKLLHNLHVNEEEIRRMLRAQKNLKIYVEYLLGSGDKKSNLEMDLHWESWDQIGNLRETSNRNEQRSTPQSDEGYPKSDSSTVDTCINNQSESSGSVSQNYYHHHYNTNLGSSYPNIMGNSPGQCRSNEKRYTPPPTPSVTGKKGDRKFPTTPPPSKKHQTTLHPEAFPLTKSKSHDEHLANKIEPVDPSLINTSCDNLPRRRLATEPGLETGYSSISQAASPSRSPPFISPEQPIEYSFEDETLHMPTQLTAPRSPRSRGMAHSISHRFASTVKVTTCHLCEKQMIIGFKCKECKFMCHRDCAEKVPPSCGLPRALVDVFVQSVREEEEGRVERDIRKQILTQHPGINIPAFPCPDSSSNTSSCNSSSPSSPAFVNNNLIVHHQTPPPSTLIQQHFKFPEVQECLRDDIKPGVNSELVDTQKSNDSDKTASGTSGSGSISTDSEKTLAGRVDSQDSQVSDVDPTEKGWPRQNSLSLKEWDIPYDELLIEDKIGPGRFGTVYRGKWYGSVAIKMLSMDPLDDRRTLETFKQEVATFRKTRHENLVLFMGACMKPPHLAIVTSLCKGLTLYTHIHIRKDKFILSRTISIAKQISQGMGYLHARGIVHKDLKTKNIFYENGKVVITDFGLFSLTKLCQKSRRGEWLAIPKGWLCYLAPEVIRSLRADSQKEEVIPFTKNSDVYAFGTVWYELLCGDWPFQGLPPEAVIWQVGKGIRQSLANIQSSKEVKDMIMMCWSYKATDRPDFGKILTVLSRLPLLPKRRLARSPSHPVHLSRSAESVF